MELPLQVTFHGLGSSEAVTEHIRRRTEKLETFFDRITSCRVAVETPHKHKHEGFAFRVRIDIGVPGKEIVVSREVGGGNATVDAYSAIDSAFDDVTRTLQNHARLQRGDVKQHEHAKHGVVAKLFSYEGYGFIGTEDGEELYFHRNSVLNHAFDRMCLGARVRFVEEEGDDGVHASSVALLKSRAAKSSERVA